MLGLGQAASTAPIAPNLDQELFRAIHLAWGADPGLRLLQPWPRAAVTKGIPWYDWLLMLGARRLRHLHVAQSRRSADEPGRHLRHARPPLQPGRPHRGVRVHPPHRRQRAHDNRGHLHALCHGRAHLSRGLTALPQQVPQGCLVCLPLHLQQPRRLRHDARGLVDLHHHVHRLRRLPVALEGRRLLQRPVGGADRLGPRRPGQGRRAVRHHVRLGQRLLGRQRRRLGLGHHPDDAARRLRPRHGRRDRGDVLDRRADHAAGAGRRRLHHGRSDGYSSMPRSPPPRSSPACSSTSPATRIATCMRPSTVCAASRAPSCPASGRCSCVST